MIYVKPEDVTSPRNHIELVRVLYDGKDDPSYSIAIVKYDDGDESYAMRWNISSAEYEDPDKVEGKKQCIGNPVSRGYPTWFVSPFKVDKDKEDKFIKLLKDLTEKTK